MINDVLLNSIVYEVLKARQEVIAFENKEKSWSYNDMKFEKYGKANNIFTYVKYHSGTFCFFPYNPATYAISDGFSGCIFVVFYYDFQWYIGHLANDSIKWTDYWLEFVRVNKIEYYTLFYPAGGRGEMVNMALKSTPLYHHPEAVGLIIPIHRIHQNDYEFQCYSFAYTDPTLSKLLFKAQWSSFTEKNTVFFLQKESQCIIDAY